jgi:16S rRNA (guanine966-N2)-methyltransferase
MRVIAGKYRSRLLKAPNGLLTRPTSDRLRETLFNVLAPRIESARFLDLYAGSGAVGIEAISRDASHVTFVEQAAPALKILRANLAALSLTSNFSIEVTKVSSYLRESIKSSNTQEKFDLVFLDPPYDAADEYETTLRALGPLLAPNALVIAEHRRKDKLPETITSLKRTRLLEQGDAALSFYQQSIP